MFVQSEDGVASDDVMFVRSEDELAVAADDTKAAAIVSSPLPCNCSDQYLKSPNVFSAGLKRDPQL